MIRVVSAAIALLVLAGCGTAAGPTAPSPGPTASVLDGGCVRPADHSSTVTIGSSTPPVYGVLMGTGDRGVLLSHQSDGDLCQMLPIARILVAHGLRVLAWDPTLDPLPELHQAAQRLRAAGARHVVLLGASMGAKQSLIAATTAQPPVDGVVALSAESTLAGAPVAPYVARLTVPTLFVTAAADPYGSAQAATTFEKVSPSRHKRLLRVPGSDHGVDLLAGSQRGRVLTALLSFLDSYDG